MPKPKQPKATSLDDWAAGARGRIGAASSFDRPEIRALVERYVQMYESGQTRRPTSEFAAWLRQEHGLTEQDNTIQGWVRKLREQHGYKRR